MEHRYRGIGAILSIALLLTLSPLAARGQPSRAELLKQSSVVVIGTVEGEIGVFCLGRHMSNFDEDLP